ncbi:MAG TPA: amidophosphoribosyltransferase [Firmicutes bacterium]|nr:amidophosphoribosyltransferase [Bacillota bacterium]
MQGNSIREDIFAVQEHFSEECGVAGIFNKGELSPDVLYFALHALQHRGQESAGIAAIDGKKMIQYKNLGLVSEVFNPQSIAEFKGKKIAVGHVRYSTKGSNTVVNAQPLVANYRNGVLAVAHNGTLLNSAALAKRLQNEGAVFQTQTDTEIFVHLLARYSHLDIQSAVRTMMNDLKGSYSLVIMNENMLIGVRDPKGIRPLCLGQKGSSYILASESVALDAVGATLVRDIEPGEIIMISDEEVKSLRYDPLAGHSPSGLCIFEYVYLARPDSVIDGLDVMGSRLRVGASLARLAPVEADMVAGVPDSGLAAAIGYSRQSGIPYGDALIKNRYVGRSFIQPEQSMRELAVRMKLNATAANVRGKRIVLIDDSIVRGTTSKRLVDMLKSAGAKEVHMRICSPPVSYPCYFGIDTPSKRHLISATHSIEDIRKMIGADTLTYLPLEELVSAVKDNSDVGFCTGCFDGNYPLNLEKCRRCAFAGKA